MEAVHSSEISVNFYKTTQPCIAGTLSFTLYIEEIQNANYSTNFITHYQR
jgi:hypothetical protein